MIKEIIKIILLSIFVVAVFVKVTGQGDRNSLAKDIYVEGKKIINEERQKHGRWRNY